MLIEIILALLAGILLGTFTGLVPGIHINLVGVFLISLSSTLFLSINPVFLAVFIVAMAITHTFIDFIPSIFLGCPDTDTELSVLPGHELLKNGQGYQAIMLTNYGSLAAVFMLILITIPSFWLFPKIYEATRKILPFILIGISFFLILLERKKINATIVFLLTGVLGFFVLNYQAIKEPLLPLLTGLFGSSMLIMSIKSKTQIPKQEIIKPKIGSSKPFFASLIASPLCGFLPGLGSGQAAIIGQAFSKTDKKGFLVLLGITNTLVMGFSFVTLYLISKTRTGAANAIKQLIGTPTLNILILFLAVILISGIIAFFLTDFLARIFSEKINVINYSLLSKITLMVLCVVVFLVSGFLGLFVLLISTLAGLYCISLGVRRTQMMGCLLIPTILIYLFGI